MGTPSDRRSFLIIITVFSLVTILAYTTTLFARGYRLSFQNGSPNLKITGLLSVTSRPKSASVYVNNRLITATDDTLNLAPGDYQVKIIKDGYLPWEKTIKIKQEIVFQTDAELFRSAPDLKPITITGAINPQSNPDGNLIVYSVASASATTDNGLYLIQTIDGPLTLNRNLPKKIAPNYPTIDWSKFQFTFSPDSKSILASNSTTNISFLLPLDSPITSRHLIDVTPSLDSISEQWVRQNQELVQVKIDKIPAAIRPFVATDSASNILFSSDDTKVLYLTKTNGQIPDHLFASPPAQSTQTQYRYLEATNYYVYDLRDDTNFRIGQSTNRPSWLPNSHNLIFARDQAIQTIEYDATNPTTLYAGSFSDHLIIPWADGNRLVTLISPYPGAPYNLYSISIR